MEENNQNKPQQNVNGEVSPESAAPKTTQQQVEEMEKQVPKVPDQPDQLDQDGKKINGTAAPSPEKDRKVIVYVLVAVVAIGIVVGLLYYFFIAETGTGFIGEIEEEEVQTEILDELESSLDSGEELSDEQVEVLTDEVIDEAFGVPGSDGDDLDDLNDLENFDDSDPFAELFGGEIEEEVMEEEEVVEEEPKITR